MSKPLSPCPSRLPLILTLTAGLFVVGCITPLGWAEWLLYLVPISGAYWLALLSAVLPKGGFSWNR